MLDKNQGDIFGDIFKGFIGKIVCVVWDGTSVGAFGSGCLKWCYKDWVIRWCNYFIL